MIGASDKRTIIELSRDDKRNRKKVRECTERKLCGNLM